MIGRILSAIAYRRQQRAFQARLERARAKHQTTRHIEAERRQWLHGKLGGC